MREILFKGQKMAKKLDDMNFVEKMTDIINVYGPTNKYNEWLEKSNTKVNPKSFAGKFLKVSFWISTFISTICIVVFMVEALLILAKAARKQRLDN